MSNNAQDLVYRHTLDDEQWETIHSLTVYTSNGDKLAFLSILQRHFEPERTGVPVKWQNGIFSPFTVYPKIGRPPEDERRNINGILWILKTGAPWRDLPKKFGRWNTVYQRFHTFTFNGTIVRIFEALVQMKYDIGEIQLDFAAIDGTLVRVHKAASGAPSKKRRTGRPRHRTFTGRPDHENRRRRRSQHQRDFRNSMCGTKTRKHVFRACFAGHCDFGRKRRPGQTGLCLR